MTSQGLPFWVFSGRFALQRFLEIEFRLDLCRLRSVCFELELQDGMYLGTLFRKRWVQIAFCSDKAGSSSSKHIISPTFFNR